MGLVVVAEAEDARLVYRREQPNALQRIELSTGVQSVERRASQPLEHVPLQYAVVHRIVERVARQSNLAHRPNLHQSNANVGIVVSPSKPNMGTSPDQSFG